MAEPGEPKVRDRRVIGIAAVIVVAVLAFSLLSVLIPPLGDAIRSQPLVVGMLIVVTAIVLIPAVRGSRRP